MGNQAVEAKHPKFQKNLKQANNKELKSSKEAVQRTL